jgi:hypothetical protein
MLMTIYSVSKATKQNTAKAQDTISTVGVFCGQYGNVATRGQCPGSNKQLKNSFWYFLFLLKLKQQNM